MKELSVTDLLGRAPVKLDLECVRRRVSGRTVLVTGAAGSIGSELCRQLAAFEPRRLVALDQAESDLFRLEGELQQKYPDLDLAPEIADIRDARRIECVIEQHAVDSIFHAAAYKHVPLMERHVFEAVENNVFGTYNVAIAAARHNIDGFVLISSDKAVRSTNVMGATKRVGELLLQSMQNGGTQYVMVRFGNVLGSSGSVIPIFKKQIAAGGPVTVTHPEMRRYFMTIPEACQLVLQAAAIAEGGQVCVLDMGQPVKIVDLARNLILLSGLKPDEDIRIEYSGIRPGEKLYEELSTLLEDTMPTDHSKVRIYTGNGLPHEDLESWLNTLREVCRSRDVGRLIIALKETVPDYNPSADLLRKLISPLARGRAPVSQVFVSAAGPQERRG